MTTFGVCCDSEFLDNGKAFGADIYPTVKIETRAQMISKKLAVRSDFDKRWNRRSETSEQYALRMKLRGKFLGSVGMMFLLMVGMTASTSLAEKNSNKRKSKQNQDRVLRKLLSQQSVGPLDPGPPQVPAQVQLGQALFFDGELSGNRDIACATCHHPFLGTGDELSLPIGTGAITPGTLGHDRVIGLGREIIPRNAPEIFNRGSLEWFTQFWDGRIEDMGVGFISPAGAALPPGLPNVLAVQAMFPVTSRAEMRGAVGDADILGNPNELALLEDGDLQGIWDGIMVRLLLFPGYQALFEAAFPNVDSGDLGFEHAAIAIAAFEAEAYTFLDSPWDKYLEGDNRALSKSEKRGALLFYGKAQCSSCHSGSLMTDQQYYNIGVPQLGPGKGAEAPLDFGRGRETGNVADAFRFRTPPLRNCEVTGPYMHDGAFSDLRKVVRHHATSLKSLVSYDPDKHLDQSIVHATFDPTIQTEVELTIELDRLPTGLTKSEIRSLVKFLESLTAPNLKERLNVTIPDSVPSGLPIDGVEN